MKGKCERATKKDQRHTLAIPCTFGGLQAWCCIDGTCLHAEDAVEAVGCTDAVKQIQASFVRRHEALTKRVLEVLA